MQLRAIPVALAATAMCFGTAVATELGNVTVVKHSSFAFAENKALWVLGGTPVHNDNESLPRKCLSQFFALDLSKAWNASQPIVQQLTPNTLGCQTNVPMVFAPKSDDMGAVYAFGHDHHAGKNTTARKKPDEQEHGHGDKHATNVLHVYQPDSKRWVISSLVPKTNNTDNQTSSTVIRHRIHEAVADPDSYRLYLLPNQAAALRAEDGERASLDNQDGQARNATPVLYILDTQTLDVQATPLPAELLAWRSVRDLPSSSHFQYPYQAVWSRSRKSLLVMGALSVTVMHSDDHDHDGAAHGDLYCRSAPLHRVGFIDFVTVHEFRNGTWTKTNTTGDIPLLSSVACVSSAYDGNMVVIYGEASGLTRIYTLNTTTMIWHAAVCSESAEHWRAGAACAVSGNDYFLAWGGDQHWHREATKDSGNDFSNMAVSVFNFKSKNWVNRYIPTGKDGPTPPQPTHNTTQTPTQTQTSGPGHTTSTPTPTRPPSSGTRVACALLVPNSALFGLSLLFLGF